MAGVEDPLVYWKYLLHNADSLYKQMRYGLLFFDLHVLHEQRVICPCRDDSDLDPVLWIPVEKLVIHIHLIKGVQVICKHKEKLSGSCGKYCPLL